MIDFRLGIEPRGLLDGDSYTANRLPSGVCQL